MRTHAGWIPGVIAALFVAGCATQQSGGDGSSGGSSGTPSEPGSSGSSGSSGPSGQSGSTTSGSAMPSTGTGMPSTCGGASTSGSGTTAGTGTKTGTGPPTPRKMPAHSGAGTQEGVAGNDPAGDGAAGRGAEVPTGSAQTPEERRATVDRRLDESIGTFDERVRKEQEAIARERDSRAGNGGASADTADGAIATADTGNRPGDLKSDRNSGTQAGKGDEQGATGPARTSAGTGGTGKGAVERSDGSDDDIVARRLRRAAEQETDPELKEKLWKEYEDYKKSVRGG